MIEHVSLRCPEPKKSRAFYAAALKPLGYKQDRKSGDSYAFVHRGRHDFWVTPGKVGTPLHIAFLAGSTAEVDAFHRAALKAGGRDNGLPGPRPDYGYAAFVLDPDGNNVEAVIWSLDTMSTRG
jgi:catechol 2,3-dioxygenase-like lactoylglutathione lyase family enzyme